MPNNKLQPRLAREEIDRLSSEELARLVSPSHEEFVRETEELNRMPMSPEAKAGWQAWLETANR